MKNKLKFRIQKTLRTTRFLSVRIIIAFVVLSNLISLFAPLSTFAADPATSSAQPQTPTNTMPVVSANVSDLKAQTIPVAALSADKKPEIRVKRLLKDNYLAGETINTILENASLNNVAVQVIDNRGNDTHADITETQDGNLLIVKIKPSDAFLAGNYTLKTTSLSEGAVAQQNFTWGVLAINTNKSIYLPNEKVNLAMAVLDQSGNVLCDAQVKLTIQDPSNHITTLSTQGKTILTTNSCTKKEVTQVPDYQASFSSTNEIGNYLMNLTAITSNGSYTINDSFEVADNVPFDVERSAPTRIYPENTYPVAIKITPTEDFSGTVTEIVPKDFNVTPSTNGKTYDKTTAVSQLSLEKTSSQTGINATQPFIGDYQPSLAFGEKLTDPTLAQKYADDQVQANDGLDFSLPPNTPVLATDNGAVVRARENSDYGTTVVIQHSWGRSYYGYLNNTKVKEGDEIKRGDEIGLSGLMDGQANLHFALKLNDSDRDNGYFGKIDPSPYVGLQSTVQTGVEASSNTAPQVQVLTWNLNLKKGIETTLAYNFKAPNISPQFYTLGPLSFFDSNGQLLFSEQRVWQIASDATITYTGKHAHTVEYVLGGNASGTATTDNTSRASGTTVYAGTSWSTTATATSNCAAGAGCKNVVIGGTGIIVQEAYIEVNFHINTAGGNNDLTDVDATMDVEGSATAGNQVRVGQTSAVIIQDRAASDLTDTFTTQYDVTAMYDRQSDSAFNSGLDTIVSVTHSGGARSLTSAKLVITYQSDYSTTSHTETKTVRFPLSSTGTGDTGSTQAACAASTACDFSYTASMPDLTSTANIEDVYFEIHAEINSATASTLTPRHNNNGTLGTNGPSYAWVDAIAGDTNVMMYFRPTVGTNDFNPTVTTTGQKLRITTGTVAANVLGAELVVTYNYSTGASTQVDTVQYYMNQQASSTAGTKTGNSSVPISISNTGLSVKNIWYKAFVAETETNTLTLFGTVGAGTERSSAFQMGGSNTIRAGENQVIYFDLSQDATNFSTHSNSLTSQVQWTGGTPGTGDAPVGVEAYLTFQWSGSQGGTQTQTIKYARAYGGVTTTASEYYNTPINVTLPETVTKTYRSAYLLATIGHTNATNITVGTVNLGVDANNLTSNLLTVTEGAEEGTTTTAEGYQMNLLYNITPNLFADGTTIPWTSRVFETTGTISAADETYRSNEIVVTYDASLAQTDPQSSQNKQTHTIEYVLGGSTSGSPATDNAQRTTGTTAYAGNTWTSTSTLTSNCAAGAGCKNVVIAGSGIKVLEAYLDVNFHHLGGNNDLTDVDAFLDVEGSANAGSFVRVGQTSGVILQDRGTSDFTSDFTAQYDAASMFDRQSDSAFNSGLDTVAAINHTGGTRTLTSIRLVITYEANYSTSAHTETKTVRFPLSSTTAGDTGSKQTSCAASTACDFSYTASMPDLTSTANIEDVYFEIHAEINSATASTLTPRHNNNGTLGTNGTAYAWADALAGDTNTMVYFRPTIGTNDFNPTVTTTGQKLRITMGSVPANVLGAELVVTYNYSTSASTQVNTVQYFMKQQTSNTAGTKTTDAAVSTTISNTGLSVKNIWYKAHVAESETNTLTIFGKVASGTERSNAYVVGGTDTTRVGNDQVIYFDISQDAANYSSATTNLSSQVQWTGGTPTKGSAPVGIEAYVTFQWSGSSGGTQTQTVKYGRAYGGSETAGGEYYNVPMDITLSENAPKTYRDAYLTNVVGHHQTTSITAGTTNMGVDETTGGTNGITITEPSEDITSVAATAEGYQPTFYYDIGSSVFAGGSTFTWTNRTFEATGEISSADETYHSYIITATYDANLNQSPTAPTLSAPFDNEKTGSSTPNFDFTASDPDGSSDLTYEFQLYTGGVLTIDCVSSTSCAPGSGSFTNTVSGGDTDPFNTGQKIRFVPGSAFTTGTTYFWRVRAKDVTGANIFGSWSTYQSVTYVSGTSPSQWLQTDDGQFGVEDSLSGTQTTGSGSVGLSRGALSVVQRTTGGRASSGSPLVVTFDQAPAQNNLLLMTLFSNNASSNTDFTPPAGWTAIAHVGTGGSGGEVEAFYKVAGSSEPNTYSFTTTGDFLSAFVAYEIAGADTTTPIGNTSTNNNFGSTATVTGVTTTINNSWFFGVWGMLNDDPTFRTAPSGWYPSAGTNSNRGVLTAYLPVTTAGSTGNGDITTSGFNWETIGFVVQPLANTSGTIMSPEISYSSVSGASSWGTTAFSTTETSGDITLQLYYTSSTPCDTIIPDSALATNSTGFDVSASPINISALNTTTYNKICLKANLTGSTTATPTLNDWTVSWTTAAGGPTLDQLMRHGKYFSGGSEQPFTF